MTEPVYVAPTPVDLGLYMNDDTVYAERAQYLIVQAETLCLGIVNPLPVGAVVVVVRVAARAYVTISSARAVQAAQKDNPYAPVPSAGGVWLTAQDRDDLYNFAGVGGGAFNIDTLGPDYVAPCLPWWDQNIWDAGSWSGL